MKTILIIIGVILLILLVLYFLFGRDKSSEQESQTTLPPSVQRLVPPSWKVITNKACDFDGDGQDEWLVVYSYDSVNVQPAGQSSDTKVPVSPIGGAIYDATLESPAEPDTSQYQVTSITPYRLLPDFAIGKGQGYLGESVVQTLYFPPITKDGKCKPTEVGFLGYSRGNTDFATSLPTHLSLFHWVNKDLGYQGSLFVGNARVDAVIPTEPDKFVTQVTTYNLVNDRSLLCQMMTYERSEATQALLVVPGSTTLDFCYGAPADPTYPDGTVAALLRGNKPPKSTTDAPMPPGESYLLPDVPLPPGLTPPVSILALTNTASAAPVPGGGHICTPEYGEDGQNWWCGQLATVVTSEVPVNGVVREVAWNMISVSQKDVVAEMHWRITKIMIQQ
jgi:hypothetical protein